MIFSHFKRRRGIRFDDGFRHSARDGAAPDPLVATYDAILATDPAVPVMFQLTEYRGQQVLWQDPACSIPVEDIGDPIGGVRHPETGEILAVQETDADRPVWGGREVGAEFGDADELVNSDPVTAQPTGSFSVIQQMAADSGASGSIRIMQIKKRGSSDSRYYTALEDGGRFRAVITDESGPPSFLIRDAGDYYDDTEHVFGQGYQLDGSGGATQECWVDGAVTASDSILEIGDIDADGELSICGPSAASSGFVGTCKAYLFYDRYADIAQISETLL